MKLSRKGFTLIELLAVIVILAVIMLIATPTILNLIEDARQGAAKSSAMGYINAVEKEVMASKVLNTDYDMDLSITTPGAISIRGQAPDSVNLTVSNGIVTSGSLKFDKYVFTVTGNGNVSLSAS